MPVRGSDLFPVLEKLICTYPLHSIKNNNNNNHNKREGKMTLLFMLCYSAEVSYLAQVVLGSCVNASHAG